MNWKNEKTSLLGGLAGVFLLVVFLFAESEKTGCNYQENAV